MKIRGFVVYKLLSPHGRLVHEGRGENLFLNGGFAIIFNRVWQPGVPILAQPSHMVFGESSVSPVESQTSLQGTDLTVAAFTSKTRINNEVRCIAEHTNTRTVDRLIGEIAINNSADNIGILARFLIGGGVPLAVPSTYKLEVAWNIVFGDPF